MNKAVNTVISGTGSCVPEVVVENNHFLEHHFYEKNGEKIARDQTEVIAKFQDITEIEERRYAAPNQVASDLGYIAALRALESSGTDPETLDYIIVAHNFGDVPFGSSRADTIPTIASKIKHKLGIKNPDCVAFDLILGCPGWVQGAIQANYYIRSGEAQKVMVIGTETLSRVTDPHDRDSMIYSDGAGATIFEPSTDANRGIIAHKTQTHTESEAYFLYSGLSSNDAFEGDELFIKMDGRKIYEFALTHVPLVMKSALEKSGLDIYDVKKVLVHQANAKMDEAILKRLFKLYGISDIPAGIMPMTISKYGNSSVATVPTLLDEVLKGQIEGQEINPGDIIVFASVGAGMNINAIVYRH